MAAALTTLRIVEERGVADHVWALGQRLIDGLNAIARDLDVPALSFGEPFPPMPFLRFNHPHPETNDALRTAFYEASIGNTSRPARCVARVQDMRLSTLRDRDCTGQYIEKLVFVLVPVIIGGPCPGMKRLHVRSVLRKPSRVR